MPWNEFRTHIGYLPTRQQQRVHQAFELGQKMHSGQKRKSGEPYFSHPIAVAHMLADMEADGDTLIAALLHDTVEDTPLTLKEIDEQFGPSATNLIEGVTKLSVTDVAGRPNLDEQIETLRKIFTLMEKDVRIMVIKLVDRLHNMQTIEFLPQDKQRALAQETLDVYVKIADRLCMQDVRDELEGLALNVLDPEMLGKLSALRGSTETRGEEVIHFMQKKIKETHGSRGSIVDLVYEHKTWDKIREQLETEGTIVTGISAITVVFRCPDTDSCYTAMGILHQLWKREVMSFQDFINTPTVNGYRGLHTTVILENGMRVRCKIRTEEMHDYARKGITLRCFLPNHAELLEHLPWAERITPLTQDTQGQSSEFWQSLQSDILGESIVIHGPGDQSVIVPTGSTALDGAFYLFREEALNLTSISIAGKQVAFSTPLQHAASLNVTVTNHPTVDRKWLDFTKTGFTTAMIRSALARGRTNSEKVLLGKELLQRILTEHKKGFLEEFDEQTLAKQLRSLGYSSLNEAEIAVADGRLDPEHLYKRLFAPATKKTDEPPRDYVIRYNISTENPDMMDRISAVNRKHAAGFQDIRYSKGVNGSMVSVHARITPTEQKAFRQELAIAGAESIEIHVRSRKEFALLAGVIILWALNPVFAKWLLTNGMTPVTLITLRFLTFAGFAGGFFVFWRLIKKRAFTSIPNLTKIAALPTVGNAALSTFTYLTLLFLPPSLHLTILRLNTFIIDAVTGRRGWKELIFFAALLIILLSGGAIALIWLGQPALVGIMFSIVTLLSYTMYSLSTERALQQYRIDVRYPYLLLRMGILLGVIGLAFMLWQPQEVLHHPLSLLAIGYVLLCVCIPHTLYSALLKTAQFKNITDFFLLEVPLAMLFEVMILGTVLPPILYAVMGFTIFMLFFLRWQRMMRV